MKSEWPHKLCWHKQVAPRAGAFLWTTLHERVLTGERLKLYGIQGPSICTLCWQNEESLNHLLLDCPFAIQCWNWLNKILGWECASDISLKNWITSWPLLYQKSLWGSLWIIAPSMVIWKIWKERNRRIFEGKERTVERIIEKIQNSICEVANAKVYSRKIEYISDWDKKVQMEWK
jgi:hypothetical protein